MKVIGRASTASTAAGDPLTQQLTVLPGHHVSGAGDDAVDPLPFEKPHVHDCHRSWGVPRVNRPRVVQHDTPGSQGRPVIDQQHITVP